MILDLHEGVDLVAVVDSVHWYGYVLGRLDDYAWIMVPTFEVER